MKKIMVAVLSVFLLAGLTSAGVPAMAGETAGTGQRNGAGKAVGIISAMDNEIALLLEQAEIERVDHRGDMDFHVGTLCGKPVVIVRSGIGKVRAAAGAATLLDTYDLSEVFFTGIAGGVGDETKVLDVVVAEDLVQHDYGEMSNDGFRWFEGFGGESGYYPCDPELIRLAYDSAVEVVGEDHVFRGTIATGDQFIASEEYVKRLQEEHHAIACEMEGAAIAVVCSEYGMPFVVIRTMSDKADGLAHETYEQMADIAADHSSSIIMRMLENEGKNEETGKIKIKALILPKFEAGEMSGDFPGEAQYYYEEYLEGGEAYEIPGTAGGGVLYVKDGTALFTLGMGKVRAALNTMAVLRDPRFDFSEALILSTGCAGSAFEYGVMGDVFVITAAVDFDLGHHADSREMSDQTADTWFYDPAYDETAVVKLDPELTAFVYEMVKDVPLDTTERTRRFMGDAFDGAEWALRDPKVLKGTTVTGDNYWKGKYDHENAVIMTETYGCPDPYALTEMEDIAVATAVKQMGLLDHFLIIRDSVNTDVFMQGATPESLWDPEYEEESIVSEDSVEAADIFETAMKNNFVVGKVVIDAALQDKIFDR